MSTQELAALFSNPDVRQLSGRKTISLPDSLLRTGGSPSVHELEACVDPVEGVIWVQGVIVREGGQENIEKQLVDRLKTSHRFPFGCTDGALGDESFGTCEVVIWGSCPFSGILARSQVGHSPPTFSIMLVGGAPDYLKAVQVDGDTETHIDEGLKTATFARLKCR